jgi:hypothetical protein
MDLVHGSPSTRQARLHGGHTLARMHGQLLDGRVRRSASQLLQGNGSWPRPEEPSSAQGSFVLLSHWRLNKRLSLHHRKEERDRERATDPPFKTPWGNRVTLEVPGVPGSLGKCLSALTLSAPPSLQTTGSLGVSLISQKVKQR